MINYIEEMMMTAGVELRYFVKENSERMKAKAVFHKKSEAEIYQANFGGELTVGYDFTPEKQLEIIKLIGKVESLLADEEDGISFSFTEDKCKIKYNPYTSYYNDDISCGNEVIDYTFENALAQLTTELMKAGELNKEKVKEILE